MEKIINQGEFLKKCIKNSGLSQKEFCERSKISKSTLHRHGDLFELDEKNIGHYSHCLGIDPISFKTGKIQPAKKSNPSFCSMIAYSLYADDTNYNAFIDDSFEIIMKEIELAKNSIIVVDYLKNNFLTLQNYRYSDNYYLKYSEYLKDIREKVLQIRSFTYEHYFQCPLASQNTIFDGDKTLEGIDVMSGETISHFIKLKRYKVKLNIWLIKRAFRSSNHVIIDNKAIIIEYLGYNEETKSRPEVLFVEKKIHENDCDSNAHKMIESHKVDPVKHSNRIKKIELIDIHYSLKQIKRKYEKCIQIIEEKIKGMKMLNEYMSEIEKEESKRDFYSERLENCISKLSLFGTST